MVSKRALIPASLLFQSALAMPWTGPIPTPIGLMALAGVSPRPTEPPGLNGVPQELRRREDVQYPRPANWCGFVNSIYDDPLSCSKGLTCVNSGEAIGCCSATTGPCTALYTTCVDHQYDCSEPCLLDPAIKKCDALEPFCGTYAFTGDTTLFDCMASSMPIQDVQFMNDFYMTAIGSTLAPDASLNPFGFTASVYLPSFTDNPTMGSAVLASQSSSSSISRSSASSRSSSGSSASSSSVSNSGSGSSITSDPPHSGLSQGAIDGIAAGVAIIGALILGLVAFCCFRVRRRKRIAAASRPPRDFPPPMQQQAQPPPKAFEGYQPVPQQEQQYSQYPGPHQQAQPYSPPTASAISPQSAGANDPRFSTANNSLLFSALNYPEQRQSYHKSPLASSVTEIDGTMGNPGVPAGEAHGMATEVDGTMGNPGIPAGGHGIERQMMPGGSPSAAEIDGRMSGGVQQAPRPTPVGMRQQAISGASSSQPYPEGRYELGHEGR